MRAAAQSWDISTLAQVATFVETAQLPPETECGKKDMSVLRAMLRWFRGNFSVCCNEQAHMSLTDVLQSRGMPPYVGSSLQLCLLLRSVLASLGFRARMVFALDPRPALTSSTGSKSKSARMAADRKRIFDDCSSDSGDDQVISNTESTNELLIDESTTLNTSSVHHTAAWVEVFIPKGHISNTSPACCPSSSSASIGSTPLNGSEMATTGDWINIDPIHNVVGDKTLLEHRCRARRASVAYVVAAAPIPGNSTDDCFSVVQDVTSSYATNPSRTRSKRLKRKDDITWWKSLQEGYCSSELLTQLCSDDFKTNSNLGVLPTNKTSFQNHPMYALKALFNDRQVLRTGSKPLGLFAGSIIYKRQDVLTLRTSQEWRRLGREVRDGELPYEQSSPLMPKPGDSSSVSTQALFSKEQTDILPVPTLIDGKIPRNEHGNIAIWGGNPRFVPKGAVYVGHRLAASAATELGVDFVEALVGFREQLVFNADLGTRLPRQVPELQGVVVLEAMAELVEDGANALEAVEASRLKEVRWKRVCKKWAQLTQSLTLRHDLRQSYGA